MWESGLSRSPWYRRGVNDGMIGNLDEYGRYIDNWQYKEGWMAGIQMAALKTVIALDKKKAQISALQFGLEMAECDRF